MKSNIESIYRMHDSFKIFQGDILRDVNVIVGYDENHKNFNEFFMEYIIILSQDCDLEQDYNSYQKFLNFSNQFDLSDLDVNSCSKDEKTGICSMYDKLLPSVLVCPAFPAKKLREGIHLNKFNNYILPRINSSNWKLVKDNQNSRYHFLKAFPEYQIPDLVIDFKRYYTLPIPYVYSVFSESYVGSLNELYRERVSQRFVNYLSRIGLPDK